MGFGGGGGGNPSSLFDVFFVLADGSGDSTVGGGGGCAVWAKEPDCVWRLEERAMICSCLAAEGERSKCEETDRGLATDGEPRWDWPDPSTV